MERSAKRLGLHELGVDRPQSYPRGASVPLAARRSDSLDRIWRLLLRSEVYVKNENDLAIPVAGTLTGLLAILIEELDRAGSLSRSQITQRLEGYLHSADHNTGDRARPHGWLEKAIIVELRSLLLKPSNEPFKLAVVAGTDVDPKPDDPA